MAELQVQMFDLLNLKESVRKLAVDCDGAGFAYVLTNLFKQHPSSMGTDRPWPLVDVLDRLSEFARFMLLEENYDCTGWEEIKEAQERACEYIAALRGTEPPAPDSDADTDAGAGGAQAGDEGVTP